MQIYGFAVKFFKGFIGIKTICDLISGLGVLAHNKEKCLFA
ncbi:MAG: hypothetical protein BWY69_00211 [Planctomycetes bacterium ADurb.Bin401]|nr:MAG: hypothetical protein BWY69_00211 [Planctomycetes bacterium ADurb.Bin401]